MISEEEKLVSLLKEKHLTITTAESCTGGLVAAAIVNAPGASEVFEAGFVTYANSAKEEYALVLHKTLEKYGAVSHQTAEEMVQGVAKRTGADVAVSVTGIAGPGGGTEKKPVGLVYIGCYVKGKTESREFHFQGDRSQIREKSTKAALNFAIEILEQK